MGKISLDIKEICALFNVGGTYLGYSEVHTGNINCTFRPKAELCEIQTVTMVASSIPPGGTETGGTGTLPGGSRERNGDWDNIWGN